MSTPKTNANSALLAALLADACVGTFTGLITKKVGKVVKGVRYDDDVSTRSSSRASSTTASWAQPDALETIVDRHRGRGCPQGSVTLRPRPVTLVERGGGPGRVVRLFGRSMDPTASPPRPRPTSTSRWS